jgi:all-trans-retinol 13,14-reductase
LRYRSPVTEVLIDQDGRSRECGLPTARQLTAEAVLSTAGVPETIRLSGWSRLRSTYSGRMSFMETVAWCPVQAAALTQGTHHCFLSCRVGA